MSASPSSPGRTVSAVEELDIDECWRLLAIGVIGRLAVIGDDDAPDVMPINYLVHDQSLVFRTAPGSKLSSIRAHPAVAFETDGQDGTHRWSVVVRGIADLLTAPAEIEASGVARLMSWSPTQKDHFLRIHPRTVSGRRFPKRHGAAPLVVDGQTRASAEAASAAADALEMTARDGVLPKPSPIPHRPPGRLAD